VALDDSDHDRRASSNDDHRVDYHSMRVALASVQVETVVQLHDEQQVTNNAMMVVYDDVDWTMIAIVNDE
jgi:hypothetical protein